MTARSTFVVATAIVAAVIPQVAAAGAAPVARAAAPARAAAARPTAPSVALTAPRATAVAGLVTVSAVAHHPAGILKVVFLANNRRIGEDTTAPYMAVWNTRSWGDARYEVQVLAISRVGTASYTRAVPIGVGNTAPVVSLTAPRVVSVAGVVTVSAAASHPAGISKVVFLANNRRIGEDSTAPYSVPWTTGSWTDGRYAVQALAISRADTAAYTPAAAVTVGNAEPVASLTAPEAGPAAGVVTVSATAHHDAGISKVIFLADGLRIGEDTTAPYSITWDTLTAPDRTWQLRAVAISATGTAAYSLSVPTAVANTAAMWGDRFGMAAAPRNGIFGATSVWKQSVVNAPVADGSAAIVADLARQVAKRNGGHAALNVWQYTAQVVTVPASQRRVTLRFDDCQHKGYAPKGLLGPGGQFVDVPIPDDAVPSTGNDAALSIWSPSTDQFWSLWRVKRLPDGWHACWGGRIDSVSTNPGYFAHGFGASASGTAGIGGMLSIRDVEYGRADHAIAFGIYDPAPWRIFSWPAQRSDGSSSSSSLVMEGQRFRLDPSVDVDALPISPIAKIVAHAAQTYGMVVTEKSGTVAIGAESGTAVARATGTNPWTSYLASGGKGTDKSYNVLTGFPWGSLQALPRDYGKPPD